MVTAVPEHGVRQVAILYSSIHSPLWGDAATASLLADTLGDPGTPTRRLGSPDDAITVEYSAARRLLGIHNRAPKSGELEWWFPTADMRHNYGLITVLSSDDSPPHMTLLFAGINSDGTEAGSRFFGWPDKLEDLRKRLLRGGGHEWPKRYQACCVPNRRTPTLSRCS